MTRLHYCAGRNGESAVTGIAVNQTRTVRLAIEAVNPLGFSAVRAKRAVWPVKRLEMLTGLGFVGENRKGRIHGASLIAPNLPLVATYAKVIIAAKAMLCSVQALLL